MLIPEDLLYTKAHLWIKKVEDGLLIGVTDFAQESMGDLEYLDLPQVGAQLNKDSCFGGAETSKSVNDLFAPLDAVVADVNEVLAKNPEIINDSPYDEGWILRVVDYRAEDIDQLLDAQAYRETLD